MKNLPILLLSVCWSLGRVSHPALTRGGTVKLAPPDRGRGDPCGGACAVPGGLAVPLQLPRSPKRRAQPQQVRRLRPRRTSGASESRRSRSSGVPGKQGCRREGASAPGGIPCPSALSGAAQAAAGRSEAQVAGRCPAAPGTPRGPGRLRPGRAARTGPGPHAGGHSRSPFAAERGWHRSSPSHLFPAVFPGNRWPLVC